jgi:site-specific DNA-methyltransferase (adenine-specific)
MTLNSGLFTSARGDWRTPQALFADLNDEFRFTLDACATPDNALIPRFFSPEEDALSQDWEGVVYCNPPYGREISRWTHKARTEAERGATVVCLLPSRTDTRWWHEDVMQASEIRFLRGRLHFDESGNRAPFPSAIAIFRGFTR